ncbi:unnamed protein product [Arctia plantaginis]|uniref:Uncharacterized protein n=1 Tax=Arctia plantaginis TaxID=874455 RepID=A0A8S1BG48_ARCPL|nr:unnamed protein product [Arctia plantaginis]
MASAFFFYSIGYRWERSQRARQNGRAPVSRRSPPRARVLSKSNVHLPCCVDVPMEEVQISDWPEPPGSHAWLPAYGYQHDLMDKDDYFGTNVVTVPWPVVKQAVLVF